MDNNTNLIASKLEIALHIFDNNFRTVRSYGRSVDMEQNAESRKLSTAQPSEQIIQCSCSHCVGPTCFDSLP